MKHIKLIVLSFIIITSLSYKSYADGGYASYSTSSSSYVSPKVQEKIDRLKRYVLEGKKVVKEFDGLLDHYKRTLTELKQHKDDCNQSMDYHNTYSPGGLFDMSDTCNTQLNSYISRLRTQAVRLDSLEASIKGIKRNIIQAQKNLRNIGMSYDVGNDISRLEAKTNEYENKKNEVDEIARYR